MMFKSIKIKKYNSINGSLAPIYLKKISKFKIKRFFILYGKKNTIRGKHAHKKCTQIFIPLKGKSQIKLEKKNSKKIILNPRSLKILKVSPLTWCEIRFLTNDCLILVLCDVDYSEKEYIRKYKNFLKIIN